MHTFSIAQGDFVSPKFNREEKRNTKGTLMTVKFICAHRSEQLWDGNTHTHTHTLLLGVFAMIRSSGLK